MTINLKCPTVSHPVIASVLRVVFNNLASVLLLL